MYLAYASSKLWKFNITTGGQAFKVGSNPVMAFECHDLGDFVLLSPENVKERKKGTQFFFLSNVHFESKILLQLLSCQAFECIAVLP